MKFYILGASGFMGSGLTQYLEDRGHEVITERVEVTDFQALRKKFKETKPEVVVNFAGVRAYPNIDWCEDHKNETVAVNVGGVINVMLAALEFGAYPIQIGSGCIYEGGKDMAFTEMDPPNFFGSFYSRMRVVAQEALKELPVLQIRIRMPISARAHPRNLINKLISYKSIISVPNSVTLIEDMFPAIEKLAIIKPFGILNLVNDGYIEHKEILEMYKKIIDPSHNYQIINIKELEQGIVKAKRSNCVLSNKKAKSFGISMPALDKDRLTQIFKIYKSSLN
ncbi:MAG: sugar nucleotide-binding protein [bacterium]|nr:sugar nucleotide-binding protein [bacterium]